MGEVKRHPVVIHGIPFTGFKMALSTELQPGSVPGPGGLFDHYVCEKCGWEKIHRIFGHFQEGEQEYMFNELVKALEFHRERCTWAK